jgi:multidrug efflux system membrane fusion protein
LDLGTRPSSLANAKAALAEAKARIPETQARLEEAKSRLDEAIINFNAAEKLAQGGYASESRVASAQAAVRAAEAGVASAQAGFESTEARIQSAEAAVEAAETEISRVTITAPFSGVLESDTAETGSLLQPGALCGTVIQLDPIKLVGYIPETELTRVKRGAPAQARLIDGTIVQGQVSFLSRAADSRTRTFQLEIDIPNPELAISDGQTAEIVIASDGKFAHLLPQSALTLDNDGRLGVRVIQDDNTSKFVSTEVLRDTVEGVWLAGLDTNASVIVVGQEYVSDGVPVEPTYREVSQ